jgi:hypothetical protein
MLRLKYGCLINRTHQRRRRSVIQFLNFQDAKTSESGGRTTVQYGNNCMNQRKAYKSVKRFSGGWTNAVDYAYTGCLLTVTNAKIKKHELSGTTKESALVKLYQKCANGTVP